MPFIRGPSSAGWPVIKKNSKRQDEEPVPAERNHELAAHYEQLRKDTLSLPCEPAKSAGLALFLKGGMIAWMRAWSRCMQAPDKEPAQRSRAPHTPLGCPLEIRSQIAIILAGIILNQRWEANQ